MTKTTKPATGVVRWLKAAPNGNRVILITPAGGPEQEYEVEETRTGYNLHRVDTRTGEFHCYRLTCFPGGGMTCNCPDAMHRRQGACKHIVGLRAGLRAQPF